MNTCKAAVEKQRDLIISTFEYIWKHPETGYREWETHRYLKEVFESLGYEVTETDGIPGFYAEADTGKDGPTIIIFAEMDALVVPSHPEANPETGAVHACGHCTQTAAIVGIAAALKEDGIMDGLCGKVRMVVVPAEEGIESEFRSDLVKKGVIRYTSGKVEFLYRGMLDGGDMAFMIHADVAGKHHGSMNGGSNGLIAKYACFEGVSAHAGGLPHKGINALYAANNALNTINALRETFEDSQHIRVHPIVSCGDTSVNVIPDRVTLETFVRGATMDAIVQANRKINRAIAASAAGMGAKVHISDTQSMWPRWNDRVMMPVFRSAMEEVLEDVNCGPERWNAGCSDMGDMASIMPTIQAYVGGANGTEHGNNYTITDVDTACVDSAKIQLVAIKLFLENGAEKAKQAIEAYKPYFRNKEEYFAYIDRILKEYDAVKYEEDGTVTLDVRM